MFIVSRAEVLGNKGKREKRKQLDSRSEEKKGNLGSHGTRAGRREFGKEGWRGVEGGY